MVDEPTQPDGPSPVTLSKRPPRAAADRGARPTSVKADAGSPRVRAVLGPPWAQADDTTFVIEVDQRLQAVSGRASDELDPSTREMLERQIVLGALGCRVEVDLLIDEDQLDRLGPLLEERGIEVSR